MADLLSEVFGASDPNYIYQCFATRVVDGDACDVSIALGFDCFVNGRVRLMGIDTSEPRTRNKKEKVLGITFKARLKELLKVADDIPGKRGKLPVRYRHFLRQGRYILQTCLSFIRPNSWVFLVAEPKK